MTKLLAFYAGNGVDSAGRRIDDIWKWNDEQLEDVHDYIQWLFPTPTISSYNSNAPILTDDEILTFRTNEILKDRLRKSMLRFLQFLGLAITKRGAVFEADNFENRRAEIWDFENHNWLRITRVLMCLSVLGLQAEANAFFAWLESAFRNGVIGSGDSESRTQATVSFEHWKSQATRIN